MREELIEAIYQSLTRSFEDLDSPDPDAAAIRRAAEDLLEDSAVLAVFQRGSTVLLSAKHEAPAEAEEAPAGEEVTELLPAPTVEEVWAAHPEIYARHLLNLDADEARYQNFALIPQEIFSPSLSFEELPDVISRQCCPNKTCGATDLVKQRILVPAKDGAVSLYGYVRDSNSETYFAESTVENLIEALNDPEYWPNHW